MSVSDPLIRDIKGHALRLFNESQSNSKITDSNESLRKFCETLEKIFLKGFIQFESRTFYGCKTVDLYSLTWKLAEEGKDLTNFTYTHIFDSIKDCKNVRTSLGKFRQLIRSCLVKKCIHAPLDFMINNFPAVRWHFQQSSIIGDEILSAILLSVLLQCNKISFDLDLYNSSFLDFTWQMPVVKRFQLVPCKQMGVGVSFSENKAVIVNIEPNGVIAETGDICVGDVLDNLNGVDIDYSCKGRLNNILRMRRGLPVDLVVIKAYKTDHSKEDSDIYPPIKKLLNNLQFDLQLIRDKIAHKKEDKKKSTKAGYKATYLGSVDCGDTGNVKKIQEAMRSLLGVTGKCRDDKKSVPVMFEIGEINVKVSDLENNEVILKHSYMQISSCGSSPNLPNYIGYIAADQSCDSASKFTCYIFNVPNTEDACTVLQSIGQGFYRTHFAV